LSFPQPKIYFALPGGKEVAMKVKIQWQEACRSLWIFIAVGLVFALVPEAMAHDFWIDRKGKEFILVYGHGDDRAEFDFSKVKAAKAFGPAGGEIEVRIEKKGKSKGKGLLLQPAEPPSWLFVEVDNGYWSKTIYGWRNLPKREASRVVEAIRSFYYSKDLLAWSDALQSPFRSAQLDIVLLKNPFELKAGDSLPFKVLYQGKPLTGVEVEGLDHEVISTTDKNGMASIRLSRGRQLISVEYKEPLKDDPDADFLSSTSTLTFEVKK
jgi:nickel transport protein